jgi:phosphoglycolate phosphatase-like HAD superfamily hydrolase
MKPASESLELALRSLATESSEVVYVGDDVVDYEMAKAAGVHFLGVSSSIANLNSNHPGYEVHSIIHLPELLSIRR